MTPYKEAYKYPFIATEILSSKNKLIKEKILKENNNENYILKLIKVLDNKDILNSTIPGYITKIIEAHVDSELFYENIIKNKDIIFDIFLKYIYNDSYRDLFYLILNSAINKAKNEFYNYFQKLFDNLYEIMNKYIYNENNENCNDITELKDSINNIIYIFIKLSENNDEAFNLIINKLNELNMIQKLKENIKEINENNKYNENNINILYCINNLMQLVSNLLNIIISKNENNKFAFNKYYLSTIFEPPYSVTNYITLSYNVTYNNQKENSTKEDKDKENNENKEKGAEMQIEEEKNQNININLLEEIGITYLSEAYSIYDKYIKLIPNLNKPLIFSLYDKMTDLIILLLLTITTTSKENEEKLINFFDTFLIALIKLLNEFPEYTIINNKILEIFKLISEKNLAIAKSPLISSLKEILTEKKINDLITDEGIISNIDNGNCNNIYLVNILNLLEKQENEKISKYIQRTNEGLLENEKMDIGDYVPKMEEDIIFEKKEDIHDSEGFIFTPKKVIEDSKKIMKNLKEFDV